MATGVAVTFIVYLVFLLATGFYFYRRSVLIGGVIIVVVNSFTGQKDTRVFEEFRQVKIIIRGGNP